MMHDLHAFLIALYRYNVTYSDKKREVGKEHRENIMLREKIDNIYTQKSVKGARINAAK
jgi:hypothetical protein